MRPTASPRRLRASVSALLLALACVSGPRPLETVEPAVSSWVETPDTETRVRLTFVGTNDLHGWLEPHERAGDGPAVLGGIDIFAGYLNIMRAHRPGGVVLLDAGDMFQGTLVANMTEGEAVIKAFNLLKYDAVAVGNHEFDYGPEGDPVIALTPSEDPLGNLKKRMEQARFPLLTGNIAEKATQRPVEWPNGKRTLLIERKGVKIGIIGLTTPMTPLVTLAQNVESLEFLALKDTTLELSKELRERGAQVVALVLHAGTGCQSVDDASDLASCDPSGELYKLLMELAPGTVDVAVAGHTHQRLAHFINGTPAVQSGSFGRYFGVVELVWDPTAGRLVTAETKIWKPVALCRKVFAASKDCREEPAPGQTLALLPAMFMGREVTPDQVVSEAMRPDFRLVAKRKNEELGPVLAHGFGISRTSESALGSFVADVMREAVPGAQVAVTNSGGIRTAINAGPVTYGDVFNALPFENRLATLDLTGQQLLEFLAHGVDGKHGLIQVSGVHLQVAKLAPDKPSCLPNNSRLVKATLADGSEIKPKSRYQVVTNDFVAGGGDGYGVVLGKLESQHIKVRAELPPMREVVVASLRVSPRLKGPPADPTPRITFVEPPPCAAAAAAP
jgi:5'-nucleotidase